MKPSYAANNINLIQHSVMSRVGPKDSTYLTEKYTNNLMLHHNQAIIMTTTPDKDTY